MSDDDYLARRFEADRARLRAVAYRMLGSTSEAEDAVQDAWLRLDRADADGVDNLSGWLTTVVARLCLDRLRSRTSRREGALDVDVPHPRAGAEPAVGDPEHEAGLAESGRAGGLGVFETPAPARAPAVGPA